MLRRTIGGQKALNRRRLRWMRRDAADNAQCERIVAVARRVTIGRVGQRRAESGGETVLFRNKASAAGRNSVLECSATNNSIENYDRAQVQQLFDCQWEVAMSIRWFTRDL